jgi:hypothetical protein
MMLGWLRVDAARASCSKRRRRSGSDAKFSFNTLIATSLIQPLVVGLVHLVHSTRTDLLGDAVVGERLADHGLMLMKK